MMQSQLHNNFHKLRENIGDNKDYVLPSFEDLIHLHWYLLHFANADKSVLTFLFYVVPNR